QPLVQCPQVSVHGPELALHKNKLAFPRGVGDHYGQHLLVHIDTGDPVTVHDCLLLGAGGEHAWAAWPFASTVTYCRRARSRALLSVHSSVRMHAPGQTG